MVNQAIFEYKVLNASTIKGLEDELNLLGMEGFQFVDVVEIGRVFGVIMEREEKISDSE